MTNPICGIRACRALIFCCLLLPVPSLFGQSLNVAVNDLQALGVDSASALIVSDRLRNELFRTGVFTVLERKQMKAILEEQGFQQMACASDACIVEAGQLLGVRYIVSGTLGRLGRTYTLSTRMIDVASGRIVRIAGSDCPCEIDQVLARSTTSVAQQLAGKIPEAKPASAPQRKTSNSRAAQKPRKALKISLASAAAAGLLSGLLLNQSASADIDESRAIQDRYQTGRDNNSYDTFNRQYRDRLHSADTKALLRNIAYGVAGAGALGLTITLAF